MDVEAYRETGGNGWAPMTASRITAVPGAGGLGRGRLRSADRRDCCSARSPGGDERVTLVRPARRSPSRRTSANAASSSTTSSSTATRSGSSRSPIQAAVADTVHAIDLDGDGTDELLVTYFLSPLERRQQPDRGAGLPLGRGSLRGTDRHPAAGWLGEHPLHPRRQRRHPGGRGGIHQQLGARRPVPDQPRSRRHPDHRGLRADRRRCAGRPAEWHATRRCTAGAEVGLGVLSWPRGEPPGVPIAAQPMQRAPPHRGRRDRRQSPSCSCTAPIRMGSTCVISPTSCPRSSVSRFAPASRPRPFATARSSRTSARCPEAGCRASSRPSSTDACCRHRSSDDPSAPAGAFAGGRPVGLVGRDRAWLATCRARSGCRCSSRRGAARSARHRSRLRRGDRTARRGDEAGGKRRCLRSRDPGRRHAGRRRDRCRPRGLRGRGPRAARLARLPSGGDEAENTGGARRRR